MKRYKAFDCYEGYEVLCESDSLNKCRRACEERYEDTDGECDCHIYDNKDHEVVY